MTMSFVLFRPIVSLYFGVLSAVAVVFAICSHGNKKGPDPLAGRAVFAHMKLLRLRSPGETGMTGSVCHSAGQDRKVQSQSFLIYKN